MVEMAEEVMEVAAVEEQFEKIALLLGTQNLVKVDLGLNTA